MFGYFPVGVIGVLLYVIVSLFFGRKNKNKVFSGSDFASIFKQFVRILSKNSFCMGKTMFQHHLRLQGSVSFLIRFS